MDLVLRILPVLILRCRFLLLASAACQLFCMLPGCLPARRYNAACVPDYKRRLMPVSLILVSACLPPPPLGAYRRCVPRWRCFLFFTVAPPPAVLGSFLLNLPLTPGLAYLQMPHDLTYLASAAVNAPPRTFCRLGTVVRWVGWLDGLV